MSRIRSMAVGGLVAIVTAFSPLNIEDFSLVQKAYAQELLSEAQRRSLLVAEIRGLISRNGAELYKIVEGSFMSIEQEAKQKGGRVYVPAYMGAENLQTFKNMVTLGGMSSGCQAYPSLKDALDATGYNPQTDNVIAAQTGRCGHSYFVFNVNSKRLTDIVAPNGSTILR